MNKEKEPKTEEVAASDTKRIVNGTPAGRVHFTRRPRGGYYDENGNRITVDMLMKHPHEINGKYGWIDFT